MDIILSSCIVLPIMHITSDVYYTQEKLTLISTNDVFWLVLSCLVVSVVLGSVAHTLWSLCRSVTRILMWQGCRAGRHRSPADGVGITGTAGRQVRCSMTGVEAANISSQNTSTWDYQVKLNRSGSRVNASMRSMFLLAPTSMETWDIQAMRSISSSTHKCLSKLLEFIR